MPDGSPPSPAPVGEYVPLADLDRARVRTAIAPIPTAFTLTRDALQGGRRGTPAAWRRSVLATLRARDAAAFAPLAHPETSGWPRLLEPVDGPRDTLHDALEQVAATPGTALLEALETDRDVSLTPAWNVVRRNPDRWLRGYVDALDRSWCAIAPLWRRASALLERETERITAAVERGVSPAHIVKQLNTRSVVIGDVWRVTPRPGSRPLGISEEGLTVAPLVTGARYGVFGAPDDRLEFMAYPLPEVWRVVDGSAPPPASLEALIGVPRAALLRRLDGPHMAGRLADLLALTPSGITFHLRALEAAGLISRERRGRNTIVSRTTRGTQLLALYDGH
jgi:DNA-binding transcriptional ArsR family regulator